MICPKCGKRWQCKGFKYCHTPRKRCECDDCMTSYAKMKEEHKCQEDKSFIEEKVVFT